MIARGDLTGAAEALADVDAATNEELRSRSIAIAELDSDARRYATSWREAFEAGQVLPVPGSPSFFGAVFARLINDSQAASIALIGGLPPDAAGSDELATAIDSALDVALYQMHYRGDVRAVHGAVGAFRTLLGDRYILEKHRVAAELYRLDRLAPSDRVELRAEISELTGGGAAALAELAQEFATRGAYPAGAAAFHIAAEEDPAMDGRWLRGAANAEYLAGDTDSARESLERAAGQQADELAAAYDVALRHRDHSHLFEFVLAASEAPCAEPERAATGELLRARTEIVAGRSVGVAQRIRDRLQQCELPGLAATVGMALVDSGDFLGAEPLLRHAVMRRINDPELVATYLYVSDEAAVGEHRLAISAEAVDRVRQNMSTPAVLRLLVALDRTADPGVRALGDELLASAVGLSPGDFTLVSELALRRMNAGDEAAARDALALYASAADDELTALIGVARWMSNHFDTPLFIAIAYEDVAKHSDSARRFDALQGQSAAEFAWLQAARYFAGAGASDGTLEAIWGFVNAAGPNEAATWEELWSVEQLFSVLQPRDVLELGERAAAMGIPMADVQMRLGASYVEMGESVAAQRAYSAALSEDPSVLSEVMRWLERVDDRAVLIRVLHAIDPSERPYQVWVALADAHAEEAARSGLSPRGAMEHRVDARLSFRSAMRINREASFRAQTFADAGLHDVAAELHLRDLAENPERLTSLQLSLLSLAASGAPRIELDPLINRALDEFEEAALSRLRVALHQSHYTRDALDVGRRQLQLEARTSEALEATAASIIGYAIELDEIDEAQELIERYFTFPAARLAEPEGVPPARYLNVRDRDARAAALMGTASRLYERAELWALAAQTSIRRLELSGSSSQLILERALLSSLRMTGGEISRSQLERIAAAAGAGPDAWRALGSVAQAIERPEEALLCWTRVLELVPDDWSAELELGDLRAFAGEADRAHGHFLRAVDGAMRDGREAQTALYAAASFSRTGRGDLAIEVLEAVPNSTEVSLRLADYELAAGLPARALRRLARTAVPPGEAARVYLRHGYYREGVELWQRRASSMSPQSAEQLLDQFADAAFETLPFSQAIALIETTVSRTNAEDPQATRSDLLARAGSPLEAAAVLEAAMAGGGSNERWRDLAALYAVGGEWEAARLTATNGLDMSAPGWSLSLLELQAGYSSQSGVALSSRDAIAVGRYDDVLTLRLPPDASQEDRASYAGAMRVLAASGFDAEAWALLRPTLRGPFESQSWLVAAAIGGGEVAVALESRATAEPELTQEMVRELARTGDYESADRMLATWSAHGPDFDSIASAQLGLMLRNGTMSSERLDDWRNSDADDFWVATAARDMGFSSLASEFAQDLDSSDEALLWRFDVTYLSGEVDRAVAELIAALPTARAPYSLIVQALESIHPIVDRTAFLRVVDRALLERPGELELLLYRTLYEPDEDRLGLRQLVIGLRCDRGGVNHSLAWLVRRNADQAALALADGCSDIPTRARFLLGIVRDELPAVLDALEPGQALSLAARANDRGQSELAVGLATRALRASSSAGAYAQRAVAHARLGNTEQASGDTNSFLREAFDLTSDAPQLLSALSSAGMVESADLVAQALRRIPGAHSRIRSGGAAMVISALGESNPEAGIRYVEDQLPGALRLAPIAGLTVRVASLLEDSGDTAGAIATYRAHLELWPNDPTAQNNLGFLLLEHTELFDEAEDLARSAILNAGRVSSSVVDTLAWALYRQGRYEEAVGFSGQALRLSVSEPGFEVQSESQTQFLEHWDRIREAARSVQAAPTPEEPERRRRRGGRRN
ncbi:MAG: tetratricopeptide (TPR) repeat protein [Bradymonadia bacterium]